MANIDGDSSLVADMMNVEVLLGHNLLQRVNDNLILDLLRSYSSDANRVQRVVSELQEIYAQNDVTLYMDAEDDYDLLNLDSPFLDPPSARRCAENSTLTSPTSQILCDGPSRPIDSTGDESSSIPSTTNAASGGSTTGPVIQPSKFSFTELWDDANMLDEPKTGSSEGGSFVNHRHLGSNKTSDDSSRTSTDLDSEPEIVSIHEDDRKRKKTCGSRSPDKKTKVEVVDLVPSSTSYSFFNSKDYLSILIAMFPDADPFYLRQKFKTIEDEQELNFVAAKMLDTNDYPRIKSGVADVLDIDKPSTSASHNASSVILKPSLLQVKDRNEEVPRTSSHTQTSEVSIIQEELPKVKEEIQETLFLSPGNSITVVSANETVGSPTNMAEPIETYDATSSSSDAVVQINFHQTNDLPSVDVVGEETNHSSEPRRQNDPGPGPSHTIDREKWAERLSLLSSILPQADPKDLERRAEVLDDAEFKLFVENALESLVFPSRNESGSGDSKVPPATVTAPVDVGMSGPCSRDVPGPSAINVASTSSVMNIEDVAGPSGINAKHEGDGDPWGEKYSLLLSILPDADPTFLEEKAKTLYDNDEEFKKFVADALENNGYPTMKDYQRRQENIALQNKYLKDFNIENFLDIVPEPFKYFSQPTRKPNLDSQQRGLVYLKRKYRRIRTNDINAIYRKNNFNLTNTCHELDVFKGVPLKSRRPDFQTGDKMPDTNISLQFLQEVAFIENEEKIKKYLKDIEDEEERALKEARDKGELLECNCCFDDEVLARNIVTCPEGHIFCKSCVRKGAETKIGEGSTKFSCLTNCEAEFSLQILQGVLKPTVFSKLAQRKQLEEIKAAGIEDLVQCPFCDFCNIPGTGDKVFRCLNPDCMKDSCIMCKEESHIPLRCDEVEKSSEIKMRTYIEDKMTEALIRTCWKCKRKFVKIDGCNKMTCQCGALMCYICREPVKDYSHFNGQGGEEFHKCPLFSDNNSVHADAVEKVAAEAKAEIAQKHPGLVLRHDPTAVPIPREAGSRAPYPGAAHHPHIRAARIGGAAAVPIHAPAPRFDLLPLPGFLDVPRHPLDFPEVPGIRAGVMYPAARHVPPPPRAHPNAHAHAHAHGHAHDHAHDHVHYNVHARDYHLDPPPPPPAPAPRALDLARAHRNDHPGRQRNRHRHRHDHEWRQRFADLNRDFLGARGRREGAGFQAAAMALAMAMAIPHPAPQEGEQRPRYNVEPAYNVGIAGNNRRDQDGDPYPR